MEVYSITQLRNNNLMSSTTSELKSLGLQVQLPPKGAARRYARATLAKAPTLAAMGTIIEPPHEKWRFRSDHLPIGMTLDGLNIMSWNILDPETMSWVTEKDSQGINGSIITDEHVNIEGSPLTIREKNIIDEILRALNHPTHPRHLMALQECGEFSLEELKASLPSNFALIAGDDNAFIIDTNHFEICQYELIRGVFKDKPNTSFQSLLLKRLDNGQNIQLFNAHLPGDPLQPARFEFAKYIAQTFDPNVTTLAMGDMNFNELEMKDAMAKAFATLPSPFTIYSPYLTNISPFTYLTKAIDHFIFYPSQSGIQVQIDEPEQIMPGVKEALDILSGKV